MLLPLGILYFQFQPSAIICALLEAKQCLHVVAYKKNRTFQFSA